MNWNSLYARFATILAAFALCSATGGPARSAERTRISSEDSTGVDAVDPEITAEDHAIMQETPSVGWPGSALHGKARLVLQGGGADGAEKSEVYGFLARPRLRLIYRRKESGGNGTSIFYARAEPIAHALALHAGSFAPDFGCTLLAGGVSTPTMASGTYPFAEPRWFVANTGFYGRAMVGAAAELVRPHVRAAAFAGRERFVRSDRVEFAPRSVAGGRVEARFAAFRSGVTVVNAPDEPGRFRAGIDAFLERRDFMAGLQAVCAPNALPGALVGFSLQRDATRIAGLCHTIPERLVGPFARVGGRDLRSSNSYSGSGMLIERRLRRRMRFRASAEWAARCEESERSDRRIIRVGLEKKWKRLMLRVSWVSTIEGRRPLMPLPGKAPSNAQGNAAAGILMTIPAARSVSIRIAAKSVAEPSAVRGLLFSPMLSLGSSKSRIRVIFGHTAYRTRKGRPACYYYEPCLAAAYPWRSARYNTDRSYALINISINMLCVSAKVMSEGSHRVDGVIQLSASF